MAAGGGGVRPADPPAPRGVTGRSIGINSTAVFLTAIGIQLLGLVSSILFAHAIGTTDSGRAVIGAAAWFLTLASSVNTLAELRLGSALSFFLSRGRQSSEYVGTYFLARLGLVAAAGALLFGIGPPLGIAPLNLVEIFGVFLLLPIFWTISTVATQTLVALGDSVRGQTPQLVENAVRMVVLVFAAIYAPTLGWMTVGYVAGAIAGSLWAAPFVLRNWGPFSRLSIRSLVSFALPLMGSMSLLYVATNTAPFIVEAFGGGLALLAVFAAANGFRIFALQLPNAVSIPLFPRLAAHHGRGEYEEIRAKTWSALRLTSLALVPGVVLLVVYRVNILNIVYVGQYAPQGATPLAILVLSAIPAALSQIIGTSLNSIGQQRLELYVTSLQVAALFATTALLLPTHLFGLSILVATSVAVFVSSLTAFAVNTYFMKRLLAVRIQPRPILTILGSAVAAFVATSRLNVLLAVNRYYQLLLVVVVGFAVYAVVLLLVGELTREDIRTIGAALALPSSLVRPLSRLSWKESPAVVAPAAPGAAAGLRPLPPERTGERRPPGRT